MKKQTLCPECMQITDYDIIERPDIFEIRGEEVTVDARVARCRLCGEEIGMAELDDVTYRAAYNVYRARHDLLQPEQIKAIRSKYGLGQKAFARLLGWGEVTVARYEAGSLQSVSHDQALRLAEDPAHVRQLLKRNAHRLTSRQLEELEVHLGQLSMDHEGLLVQEEAARYGAKPGVAKLREMAVFFAGHKDTWRTKLNKLLFYADFLHFKRHGVAISGARYVNMQYGPVPADFYTLQASLVDDASMDERPSSARDCSGTVFVANRPFDRSLFSEDELQTLGDVARMFEGWSASAISEFSHREPAWAETGDRETIDYVFAQRLQLS